MVLLQLSCPSTITAHPYGFLGAAVCSAPLWAPAQASLEAMEMFSPQSILHQGVPSTPCRALSCSLLDAPQLFGWRKQQPQSLCTLQPCGSPSQPFQRPLSRLKLDIGPNPSRALCLP